MRGVELALGAAAALAVAGLLRRGSRQRDDLSLVIGEAKRAAAVYQEALDAWTDQGEPEYELLMYGLDDIEAALEAYHHSILGVGADRLVISSADPRFVIKIGRQSANLDEASIWETAGPQLRARLVPVVAVDIPDGRWLVMERVQPYEGELTEEVSRVIEWADSMGLMDIRPDNLSQDLKILDYGEPVDMSGSAARAPRQGGVPRLQSKGRAARSRPTGAAFIGGQRPAPWRSK
jgi:hypothetical protein